MYKTVHSLDPALCKLQRENKTAAIHFPEVLMIELDIMFSCAACFSNACFRSRPAEIDGTTLMRCLGLDPICTGLLGAATFTYRMAAVRLVRGRI